jgi:hypothetical protein
MKKIFKYELEVTDEQTIQLPREAKILSTHCKNNKICIWALVNPKNELVNRKFYMSGTGFPIHDNVLGDSKFIGTCLMLNETLVWHIFAELS